MGRRIIINADDLGLARSVNDAIFAVHRAGNLTSATLMVAMPGTGDAAERAKDHPHLAIGLHFTLTEGDALTGVSSLTDGAGRFVDRTTLTRRTLQRKLEAAHVRKEFEAQLKRAEGMGIRPTHSDSHQHVMMLPAVLDGILPVIEERSLPVRLVDPPRRMITGALGRPRKLLKQWMNARLASRHRRRLPTKANDALVSIHDLESAGPYTASTYAALVAAAGAEDVVELMVHPYILGEEIERMYADRLAEKMPFLKRCAAEYEALRGAPVFDPVELTDFSAL